MRARLAVALCALCAAACATATGVDVSGHALMNRGTTLAVLDDGAVSISGGPGYAYVEVPYADVAVRAEVTAHGNSGIFVRAAHPVPIVGGFFPSGIEAQIEAGGAPWATGALYGVAPSQVRVGDGAINMCVAVKGTRAVVVVDDQLASSAVIESGGDARLVALQAHDPWSDVVFRRLRMRAIDDGERAEEACAQPW